MECLSLARQILSAKPVVCNVRFELMLSTYSVDVLICSHLSPETEVLKVKGNIDCWKQTMISLPCMHVLMTDRCAIQHLEQCQCRDKKCSLIHGIKWCVMIMYYSAPTLSIDYKSVWASKDCRFSNRLDKTNIW